MLTNLQKEKLRGPGGVICMGAVETVGLRRKLRLAARKLAARMVFAVDVPQSLGGHVGIDFGRANAGMAEQLLNDA